MALSAIGPSLNICLIVNKQEGKDETISHMKVCE